MREICTSGSMRGSGRKALLRKRRLSLSTLLSDTQPRTCQFGTLCNPPSAELPHIRVPAYSPHAVAEHTLALLLSVKRRIRMIDHGASGFFDADRLVRDRPDHAG